jgi:putative spermidine/putrescine transport system ATP-binding protein
VTHDQAEALTMSNRVCVFDDGVVQQVAPPDVLYEQPENAFVAQFIGENNTFLGKVTEASGDQCGVQLETGEVIKAMAINIDGVESNSTLSLRPERVTINPEAGALPNNVDGLVKELIYLGDHIRARLELCGQDEFIVKVPNSSHHTQLKEGESVKVGWQVEDCRALDAPA